MASRGKRNFPFKKEAKPVVNEEIQFEDEVESSTKDKKAKKDAPTAAAAPGRPAGKKTRASLSKDSSRATESGKKAQAAKVKATSSSAKKRKVVESIDSGEDTEEQVDHEPPEKASKRRRMSSAPATAAVDEPNKKKTAHYPSSECVLPPPESRGRSGASGDTTVLAAMVSSICTAEKETLDKYFASELPGASHTTILRHLKEVLGNVAGQVFNDCPMGARFEPEVSKAEKAKMEAEAKRLVAMDRSIDILKGYLENTDEFLSDAGLLQFDVPAATNFSEERSSEKVESLAADFEDKLKHMDSVMDQILHAVDNAATVSRKARDSQQKLFDGHQKARRFDTFSGLDSGSSDSGSNAIRSNRSGDVNPKHLLKTMQNKY